MVRGLKDAGAIGVSASERAFFVTKECALQHAVCKSRAIVRDEILGRALATLMQGVRDQLFAGAGFAADVDGHLRCEHSLERRQRLKPGAALSHHPLHQKSIGDSAACGQKNHGASETWHDATVSRYEVISPLGVGGMGEVFLAREQQSRELVMLKRLRRELSEDPDIVAALHEEAELMRGLRHPNIVKLREIGRDNGLHFIAMEYVQGCDLHTLMAAARERETFIPIGVALRIIADVYAALDCAHRAVDARGAALGLMHRDVTPPNVLVSHTGQAKLADFGIAKAAGLSRVRAPTRSNTVKGTLSYLAPEQILREPVDQRVDTYAAGVILWEMLAARPLFRGKTEYATLQLISGGTHERLTAWRQVSPLLAALVERAIAFRPADRFASAAQILAALEDVGEPMRRADVQAFVAAIMN